jgi:hypothetical protein
MEYKRPGSNPKPACDLLTCRPRAVNFFIFIEMSTSALAVIVFV